MTIRPFRAPYAGGSIGVRSRTQEHLPWPSPPGHGLGSLTRNNDAAGFTSRYGPASRIHPAPTPASQPKLGASLPGTLASPRTGLTPASHRELTVKLRHNNHLRLPWRPNFWTHTLGSPRHATPAAPPRKGLRRRTRPPLDAVPRRAAAAPGPRPQAAPPPSRHRAVPPSPRSRL